jgi:potassium efflux system protein
VVTVSDVTGEVSQIEYRATTITNWDRKEFMVPNKEFITGRILNWTLSNPVNRIVVNVGIAYGSDTVKAQELLLEAAREHPLILRDPPPTAYFDKFGDSALNFTLRFFIPNLDHRLNISHDIHDAIISKLAKVGIEIAYPQRDLHIRSVVESPESILSERRDPRGILKIVKHREGDYKSSGDGFALCDTLVMLAMMIPLAVESTASERTLRASAARPSYGLGAV